MLLDLIKPLLFKLDTCVYVEFSSTLLFAKNTKTGACFKEKPLIAISRFDNSIKAFGNCALEHQHDKAIRIVNPFDHPRSPLANTLYGEKLLHFVLSHLVQSSMFRPAPKIILRPLERTLGGLTDHEIRALKEMCFGAGARDALIYEHADAPAEPINFEYLKLTLAQ